MELAILQNQIAILTILYHKETDEVLKKMLREQIDFTKQVIKNYK